jgi:hypothetical protein
MKKIVSVLLAMCLMAGLAVFAGAAGEKIRLTDHFTFDMTPSEMLAKAEELGFRPLMPGEIEDWDIDYYSNST